MSVRMANPVIALAFSLFYCCVLLIKPTTAGGWTCGASSLTAASCAVGAVSCSSIGMANYCCPAGNYCAYTSDQQAVGCCPSGQTCSGTIGDGWQHTTTTAYWQPSSTLYVTTAVPTTTVYGGIVVPGGVVTTTAQQPATTEYVQQTTQAQTVVGGGLGYCSTLYAQGGDLPTTRAGSCGTILVISEVADGLKPRVFNLVAAPLAVIILMVAVL